MSNSGANHRWAQRLKAYASTLESDRAQWILNAVGCGVNTWREARLILIACGVEDKSELMRKVLFGDEYLLSEDRT